MGTAGHIDHGKTSLVRALTGVDCDRLSEEKRRGITIELGFTRMDLPGGRFLSLIDVPGHERFVHTMAAGASGIDCALLVIAADEGVMPQTVEHLDICTLLGVRRGLVALTKVDLVDEELLELAREDVASFLAGTFLEHAPVIPVSTRTGQGVDALISAIADMERQIREGAGDASAGGGPQGVPPKRGGLPRLPVDRAFVMRGHGTVVTGTLGGGPLSVGDAVELFPSGRAAKIRALQMHGESCSLAVPGNRVSVNLAGVDLNEVERGDVLSLPGALHPSRRWAVLAHCLDSSPGPLRHRAEIHLHHGARTLLARLYFTDRDELPPGEAALCEARLEAPAAAVFGDRCVLRAFSPLRTVGGGVVLHPLGLAPQWARGGRAEGRIPAGSGGGAASGFGARAAVNAFPPFRRRALAPRAGLMLSLAGADNEERLRLLLDLEGMPLKEAPGRAAARPAHAPPPPVPGLSFALLRVLANLDAAALEKSLGLLGAKGQAFCFDREARLYIGKRVLEDLSPSLVAAVAAYHESFPERRGVGRGELATGWGRNLPPKLAHFLLERLVKAGSLAAAGDTLSLPGHEPTLSAENQPAREGILRALRESGMAPPIMRELLASLGFNPKQAAPVLTLLRESGLTVRVDEDHWYAAEHLAKAEEILRAWFAQNPTIDLGQFKTLTGLSRKYLVLLLEYFDERKVTMRSGDARVLRK